MILINNGKSSSPDRRFRDVWKKQSTQISEASLCFKTRSKILCDPIHMMGLFSTHTFIYRKRALSLADKRKKCHKNKPTNFSQILMQFVFNQCLYVYVLCQYSFRKKHAVIADRPFVIEMNKFLKKKLIFPTPKLLIETGNINQ